MSKRPKREKKPPESYHERIKFEPKNKTQALYISTIENNDITICTGVAGTGNGACAVATALRLFFSSDVKINKVVITRPTIGQGKSIGFLPGDISEKMDPYLTPIYDEIKKHLSPQEISNMVGICSYNSNPQIEIAPLYYMRGRTFINSVVICDECQNSTYEEIEMLLTRIGLGSKLILMGDVSQRDIHVDRGLEYFRDKLRCIPGVGAVHLDENDIVRHPIIKLILKALK